MQLMERVAWMPSFGIYYIVGIDGISLFLVLLTTVAYAAGDLGLMVRAGQSQRISDLHAVVGNRHARRLRRLDLFLFYVFWEVMLVPMYFLIGVWGGTRRVYAALKFVIFTMAGACSCWWRSSISPRAMPK
jgi:NADH-quinone oxidoreductase subunit M